MEKAADILNQGVNLLVVDLFAPMPGDPRGIHKAIWDELCSNKSFPIIPCAANDQPVRIDVFAE